MRVLILGDIHSNLEALEAVVRHGEEHGGFQRVWCLGDTVGYGPDPGPCLDSVRQHDALAVAGNHDHGAVGLVGLEEFNDYAAAACRWTGMQLTQEQRAYLEGLPLVRQHGLFTMAHGSLRDPLWEYLLDWEAAQVTFSLLETPRCLVSHSHVPFLCTEEEGGLPRFRPLPVGRPVELGERRFVLNPGSVGQPRDGDPRASYVVYDGEADTVTLHRVEYAIPSTQAKMARAGLPEPLIARLPLGR